MRQKSVLFPASVVSLLNLYFTDEAETENRRTDNKVLMVLNFSFFTHRESTFSGLSRNRKFYKVKVVFLLNKVLCFQGLDSDGFWFQSSSCVHRAAEQGQGSGLRTRPDWTP